jgi:hypothetical protein
MFAGRWPCIAALCATDSGWSGGATAPVLTQTSSAGANPLGWSSDYTDLIIGEDYICCRWRIDGGAYTNETNVLFDSDFFLTYGVDGVNYPWPLFDAQTFTAGQVVEVQEGILRDGVTTWSSTLSDTIGGPALTVLSAVGDSITASTSSYAEVWSDANPAVTFFNEGVGGEGINNMIARVADIMSNNPSHVSLLAGANDLYSYTAAAYYDKYVEFFDACRAIDPDVICIACGTLLFDEAAPANAGKAGHNALAATLHGLLRAGVGVDFDVYAPLGEHPLMTAAAMTAGGAYSTDGLHLNQPGAYGPISAVYTAVMDSILQQDSSSAPDAFTFSDVTGADLSTVYTSSITLTGLGMGLSATASMTGSGDMSRGQGSYATTSFAMMNGDILTRRLTSSGSTGVEVTGPTTIGGVSDTFSVSTAAASITRSEDLVAWWSAQDTTTMFETVTGTGAVSSGTVVGTFNDKSGNGLHLTATGNNSTRPVYTESGGLRYLTADGTDDLLRRTGQADGAVPIRLNGNFTIAMALKPSASLAVSRTLLCTRGDDNGEPFMAPLRTTSGTAANGALFYRADDGVSSPTGSSTSTSRYTSLFDNNLRVVILVVNAGTATLYRDGVAGTSWAVSEDGLDFANSPGAHVLSLFGSLAVTTPSSWFATDFFEGAIWDVAFNSTEVAEETTRLGALQGRTI